MAAAEFAGLEDRMAPNCAEFPRIRGGLRNSVPPLVPRRWHRLAVVPLFPERSETLVSRVEGGLKSGRRRRLKSSSIIRLQSDNHGSGRTEKSRRSGSVPGVAKWHKRPPKAATLCHFLAVWRDLETTKDVAIPWQMALVGLETFSALTRERVEQPCPTRKSRSAGSQGSALRQGSRRAPGGLVVPRLTLLAKPQDNHIPFDVRTFILARFLPLPMACLRDAGGPTYPYMVIHSRCR
jgi:hypothetical protein